LDLARDERIISQLRPLIGPDIELQHSKLAAKATAVGKGPFQWHQDFAFFPHTNTDLVAVMVMLDDATSENGCMSMVKGSHKLGLLEHRKDGIFTGGCQESQIWESASENVIPVTPKAGGISVHHCLALHGSPPNLSGQPRRGIVFQYRASDAYQLADEVWDDTGLLVAGQYREQVRCTVGTVWLPRVPTRQPRYGSAWQQQGPFAQATNEA
jgi:ectoine hydroxylase-related dioxygenase (phytanoyl-CoA dioxygenase family)